MAFTPKTQALASPTNKLLLLVLSILLISGHTCELVVGILTLQTSSIYNLFGNRYKNLTKDQLAEVNKMVANSSYLAVSYANWLEMVGIRVIALDINQDNDILLKKLSLLDGLLLTGGSEPFYTKSKIANKSKIVASSPLVREAYEYICTENAKVATEELATKYLAKVKVLIDKAREINDTKRNFPVWATCLGFEAFLIADSGFKLKRSTFKNQVKAPLPISLYDNKSNLAQFFSPKDRNFMQSSKTFYFNHRYAILTKDLQQSRYFNKETRMVGYLRKKNKQALVIYEYKRYPFFGSQFHPERFGKALKNDDGNNLYRRRDINEKLAKFFKTALLGKFGYPNSGKEIDIDVAEKFPDAKDYYELYGVGSYDHVLVFYNGKFEESKLKRKTKKPAPAQKPPKKSSNNKIVHHSNKDKAINKSVTKMRNWQKTNINVGSTIQ